MGSVRKFGDYTTSRRVGEENDIRTPQQLQCGKWGYDNDIYRRYKKENIGITSRETKNGDSEKKNFRNIEEAIFKGRESEGCFRENKKSNVEEGCSGKLFERKKEDRLSREVKKEKGNRRTKEGNFINEVIRELCRWNETDGITQDYWNILRLHKAEQITVVEHEAGFYLFKGRINLCIGGSPCQGFSQAGKKLNFDDPRSKLFFEFVRVLKETKPKYFLYENVVPKSKDVIDVISEYLGVQPKLLNSNLKSCQDRKRLYWANFEITTPEDDGILLKDIVGFSSEIPTKEETIADIKNWTSREFDVSISRRGRVRPHRLDPKKSGISEIGSLTNPNDKCTTITASHAPRTYKTPFEIYELNVNECEQVQGLPVGYTDCISERQAKKAIGNGWTVQMITHIFNQMAAQADK